MKSVAANLLLGNISSQFSRVLNVAFYRGPEAAEGLQSMLEYLEGDEEGALIMSDNGVLHGIAIDE